MLQARTVIFDFFLYTLMLVSLSIVRLPLVCTHLAPWLVITTAQADTENAAGVWTSSLTNIRFDDSWMGTFMVEPRVVFDTSTPERDGKVRQLLVLGSVGYALSEYITVAQGYANLPSYNPKRIEHRAFQDIIGRHVSERWRFIERIRLEERFLEGVRGVSLRGRFLARAQHPLPFSPSLAGVVSEELFLNFTEPASHGPQSGFDQNRFFVGINVPLDADISFELGYMNLFLEQGGPSPSVSNHLGIISVIGNFEL